jgi:hypothetical protein
MRQGVSSAGYTLPHRSYFIGKNRVLEAVILEKRVYAKEFLE